MITVSSSSSSIVNFSAIGECEFATVVFRFQAPVSGYWFELLIA